MSLSSSFSRRIVIVVPVVSIFVVVFVFVFVVFIVFLFVVDVERDGIVERVGAAAGRAAGRRVRRVRRRKRKRKRLVRFGDDDVRWGRRARYQGLESNGKEGERI